MDHTWAPTEIPAAGKRVCGSRRAGVWAEFRRVRGGPDDAHGEGAGVSAPSEGHLQSTCFQVLPRLEHLVMGHTWVQVIHFSAAADWACGGRTSAGVGGGASEEGSPIDHEEPRAEGCRVHWGARKPLPRTRPRSPFCSFSPKCPLPRLLLLCRRGCVFRPQILPKCPETQPGGWGHQQLPPTPSTPHPVRPLPAAQRAPSSPARPVTVTQPGAPSFSPHPGDREGPEPGGSFAPVCLSVPLSVHCPQHPMVMLCPLVMEPLRLFPLPVQPEVHPAESWSPAGVDIPTLTVSRLTHIDAVL